MVGRSRLTSLAEGRHRLSGAEFDAFYRRAVQHYPLFCSALFLAAARIPLGTVVRALYPKSIDLGTLTNFSSKRNR